jgi:uncharacterized protein
MHDITILIAAGFLAGAMNALAGGGSFVTLPALIALGVPSVTANASSTVALYPGGLASALTYRDRDGPRSVAGVTLGRLLAVTLAGGLAGSLLLLWTPSSAFDQVLPWLLLLATGALAFGPRLGAVLHGRLRAQPGMVLAIQLALGIYGGYFGGAVGLMMVAGWSLLGESELKVLNAPRTLMVSAANTIAVLVFIVAGAVRWPQTTALLIGGLIGGYGGARLGRIVPPHVTRGLTLCAAGGITLAFFLRAYVPG